MEPLTIPFEFPGFIGTGSCLLTIGESEDGIVTIICSQKRNYYGTSITNAIERIATKLRRDVLEGALQKSNHPQIKKLKENWHNQQNLSLHMSFGTDKVVLVEHYPAGAGISMSDSFMEVQFDESNSPQWMPALRKEAAVSEFGEEVINAAIAAQ